jgi:regulatory protein
MSSEDGLARVTYLPGAQPPEPAAPADTRAVGGHAPRGKAQGTRSVSIRALTRRDLSRWELEQTLRARDLDDDAIAEELARLEEAGLIDDAALAEMLVRTRHERKGLSRSALTAELRHRRVDQRHIDAALTQIDDDDERATARELAVARARRLQGLDQETALRRLSSFLLRKGYSSEIVRAAVKDALPQGSGVHFSGVHFD